MGNKYKVFGVTCADFYCSKSEKQGFAPVHHPNPGSVRQLMRQGVTRRNSLSHHYLAQLIRAVSEPKFPVRIKAFEQNDVR